MKICQPINAEKQIIIKEHLKNIVVHKAAGALLKRTVEGSWSVMGCWGKNHDGTLD